MSYNEADTDYGQQKATDFLHIKWQDKVSNIRLWEMTNQQPIVEVALCRPHPPEASDQHHSSGPHMDATREKTERMTQEQLHMVTGPRMRT